MNQRFFNAAFKISLNSQYKHKIGSVLVSGGRIISTGYNQIRNIAYGPKFGYWESSLHSEMACLHGISKEVSKGCDMYVFRSFRNGEIACAKPCDCCIGFMESMLIKRIYYTDPAEERGYGVIKL